MHTLIALVALALTTAPGSAPVSPEPRGVWPLSPRPPIVRGFDPPSSPWGSGHRGVDLLGHVGQQVHAARAGTITWAGTLAGRGVVVVDHGGERTTYEPVSPTVSVGDRVGAGTVIGTLQLGMSHCFPRACLHWGLIRGHTYLDPLVLVGGGPVRLLPLAGLAGSSSAPRPIPRWSSAPVYGPPVPLTPAGVPVGTPLAAGRS